MARNAGSSYRSYLTYLTYLTYPAYLSYLFVLICAIYAVRVSAHDPITTKVTWSREVVRIVNKNCANCHNKASVGPMPLTSYDEVRPWAKAIKDEVVSRRMPPWPAARGFGHFTNDPTLSPFEIELIAAWVDGGTPKGEDKDLPAKPGEPQQAKPDLVLTLPARSSPPAGERRSVTFPMALNGDRWITGWEFTPNDGAITSAEFRWRQSEPIGSWTPPERFVAFPEESGQLLPASATIEVTLTYRTSQQQHDFPIGIPSKPPQLGLMLLKTAPRFSVRNLSASCGETDVNIARGTLFAVRVTGATAGMPVGVTLAPMSARDVPGSATDPYSLMGAPLPVTWIREFDPGYQPTYRLALQLPGEFNAIIPSTPDRSQPCLVTYGLTVPRALASEPISPSTKTAR